MEKAYRMVLFWTLLLSACSSLVPSHEAPPPGPAAGVSTPASPTRSTTGPASRGTVPVSTTEVLPVPKLISTVSTPHIDQGPDGAATLDPNYPRECAYQWAYKDLPEISSEFQGAIQALQPGAQAVAFGFGEECVQADGTSSFIPMETDFNVTLPVDDLSDPEALGEWIVSIMQVVENLPPDQIIGPRPGRVSIFFESNGQRQGITFYIDQYRALDPGLSSAEIYQVLQTASQ